MDIDEVLDASKLGEERVDMEFKDNSIKNRIPSDSF
jgi:hypothetical protein